MVDRVKTPATRSSSRRWSTSSRFSFTSDHISTFSTFSAP